MSSQFPTELSQQQILNNVYDATNKVLNTSGSGGGGGGAATIADGADVTQGAIADAAASAGGTGTLSAKIRKISADVGSILTNTPAVGQTTMSASSPVTIASDQTAVAIKGNSTGSAVPSTALYMGASDGTNLLGVRTATATLNAVSGILAAGLVAQLDDTSPTSITENQFGNVRMSADRSLLVTNRATTATVTTVASSASSVSLLASNLSRKGATITNDSSAVMYIKLGATASTSSYTVTLAGAGAAPFSYYEVPFGYVGAIDAIWASATGNARITEIV